jgi:hypothetical protein
VRGSPIRTPSDQRSVGSSPRLIAASHVLHRLLVPRHPPCALNNLTQQNPTHTTTPEGPAIRAGLPETLYYKSQKMLASTVQFSTNKQPPPDPSPPDPRQARRSGNRMALHRGQPHPLNRGRVRSLRTQQRAYHHRPTPARFHTPTPPEDQGMPYWGPARAPAAELVSVPPSSTTRTPATPHT